MYKPKNIFQYVYYMIAVFFLLLTNFINSNLQVVKAEENVQTIAGNDDLNIEEDLGTGGSTSSDNSSIDVSVNIDPIKYSDVLEDLQRDSTFDTNKYLPIENDYALHVIQVAESIEDELFVYVYQPAHNVIDLIATSIIISNSLDENGNEYYNKYRLTLVSTNGVFDKYIVNDFSIKSTENERYYEITSIFRKPDVCDYLPADYDLEEISNYVSQRWYITETENSVTYRCDTIETITIAAQYPGYVRYNNGYYLWSGSGYVDGYYYAFDTDKLIEDLLEVEMVYDVEYYHNEVDAQHPLGEITDSTTTKRNIIRYDEYAETSGGLFAPKRTWKRIMLVDDFVNYVEVENGLDLSTEVKENISTCKWVVNFDEFQFYSWTDETSTSLVVPSVVTKYSVSNIQPLRFKFRTDGVTYNLGVIGDSVTPDDQPSNENTTSKESIEEYFKQQMELSSEWFEKILMLVGILILVIILAYCMPVVKVIFNALFKAIKVIFKLIWSVITAPVKLIKKKKN